MSLTQRNFRRSMIAGVAVAMVSATGAFAADWTGFYAGAHLGSADLSGDYLAETGSCNPCRVLNLDGQSTAAGVQGATTTRPASTCSASRATFPR